MLLIILRLQRVSLHTMSSLSLNVRSARTDKPHSVVLGRNVIPYPFAVFLIFLFSLTPGCPVNVLKSLTLRKNKNLPLTFCPFLGLGLFFPL